MRSLKILSTTALLLVVSLVPTSGEKPAEGNTAVIPAGKLEQDFYDWEARHASIMAIKDSLKPEYVMIGDSITHLWGGEPKEPKGGRGAAAWKDLFGDKPALNLGFGWDRTQNVLKRIELGELDGLTPKAVVIHIGTNNTAGTKNARENTPAEITEGIALIVQRVKEKCPAAKVIMMAVFPRGVQPEHPSRLKVNAINELLAKRMADAGVTYLDITTKLLNADGTISKEVMPDSLHPGAKGYAIWAEALKPVLP